VPIECGTELCDPIGMRYQPCAGQNILPLSTDSVQVTSNTKNIYSPVNSAVLPTCFHTVTHSSSSFTIDSHSMTCANSYAPKGPAHADILRKPESSKHTVNYISNLNPNCNTHVIGRSKTAPPPVLSPSSILLPSSSHRASILATKNLARVSKRYLILF